MFEATRWDGYRGDIAIDDITLQTSPCSVYFLCTFEESHLCGFSQV